MTIEVKTRDGCIHQLFEAQVERSPDALAVVYENKRLTYRQLNARANQLARHLQNLGVGPEILVGICMARSLEMVIALLGILKSGAAYVPLDLNYPKERLAFMLADTGAPVLLTEERLVDRLPENGARLVFLDARWDFIAQESEENGANRVTAENLAYVIYTSGSTGRPKGVAIEHRNTVSLLHWARDLFSLEDISGVLASTSISFDLSVFELFLPLSWGGKIILAQNVLQLPALPHFADVTLINTVPSAMAELLTVRGIHDRVRTINLAGEPLDNNLVDRIYRQTSVTRVFDLYGPSESTTYSTSALRTPEGPVTIGRPITGTQVYILQPDLQPAPTGTSGEIYIGGAGVAREYLHSPELTAEKFTPNPFSEEPGSRLYRTGDVARRRPDGDIEFLGRIDHQVKIRGFRIELGEIEAVLGQHPAVQQVVAMAREEEPGEKRLVAYVVAQPGQTVTADELRKFVKTSLPDYMVPAFVFMQALPRTPNGKIDRRALPAPDLSRPELTVGFTAPRTPIERKLAQIWSEVLGIKEVGIHDRFLDLGGHSLRAVRIASRVREILEIDLPLSAIFETPTVAALAARIAQGQKGAALIAAEKAIPRLSDRGFLPASFAQQRLWFLHQLEPNSSAYNMLSAFRLKGRLNDAALEQSLNEISRRHDVLRTTFALVDGEVVQRIADQTTLQLSLQDLSRLTRSEREMETDKIVAEEAQKPFDLATGPLVRARLLRTDDDEHIFLYAMHHIVSDGWSMDVFYRELSALYEAFCDGKPSPLPELPIQYADFAVWQRRWLQGEVLGEHLSYWKSQLADLPVLELPTDYPRPAVQSYRGGRQSLALPDTFTKSLNDLKREEGVTLFMILLAALKTLLHHYTGQEDIVVGAPFAGRNEAQTENVIGFFVNSLVLRTDLSGDPTFRQLLGRVREVALGAYVHQDLPFEKLVEELQPERDLSRTPLFQVFLNMIDLGDNKALNVPGLAEDPLEFHEPASMFDLTLYALERAGSLSFSLVYNRDLFASVTMERLLARYRILLEAVAADPDRPILALPLLTEEERNDAAARCQTVRPTNPFVEFKKEEIEQSIPARFERSVRAYPDRIAVKTRNHRWSYSDLNRAANQIAEMILRLRGRGEERIALLFEHDAPMIAAILGVLKTGKAYVPLDPAYPKERLAYILEDSAASAILTTGRNMAGIPLTSDRLQRINIDHAEPGCTDGPAALISPDALAYILYTSGSTGRPKGVMQNHRNVLHHIRNYTNNLHLGSDDRLTLFSSYSFDAAVMDIFGTLLNGATVCPMDLKEEEPSAVIARMVEEKVTVFHATPTVYRYLLGPMTGREDLSGIRLVVLGGEEAQKNDVELFRRYFSSKSIMVNGLGPTECTLALQYFIDHRTTIIGNTVPVGYPVDGVEIFFLDRTGKRAEIYGEIGIRSAHLALGYWANPETTQAAFLPDLENAKRRIYRSGDMGRLLPDGTIAFAGRKDSQVKIRGFRIELGEIETALAQYPGARETKVVAREDERGIKRLIAYVVGEHEPVPAIGELRSFLKQKLPDYMVPSEFMLVDALPLTQNGKVDLGALPVPTAPQTERTFVAPSTPAQRVVARIWAEVLKFEHVGVHDNFFDLGGHSLLATQVISRVRDAFGMDLPLRLLFERPTIEELALAIEETLIDKIESLSEDEIQQA